MSYNLIRYGITTQHYIPKTLIDTLQTTKVVLTYCSYSILLSIII